MCTFLFRCKYASLQVYSDTAMVIVADPDIEHMKHELKRVFKENHNLEVSFNEQSTSERSPQDI